MERLALKRLTNSDLTFFEVQFRNLGAGNQKSINLNANVFVDRLYPGLPGMATARHPVDLDLLGPKGKGRHNIARKILGGRGTYKNWRLNGEFVLGPDDDPDRYAPLRAGDLAVLDFDGDPAPTALRLALLSAAQPEDAPLHALLDRLVPAGGMVEITRAQLAAAVDAAAPADSHAVWDLVGLGDGEDTTPGVSPEAWVGGRGRRRPKVPKSRLINIAQNSQQIGDTGEDLVNELLLARQANGEISDLEWVAFDDAFAPQDFRFTEGGLVHLDVKTTTGRHEAGFYMSGAEIDQAAEVDDYRIYRLSELAAPEGRWQGVLREATVPREWAASIQSQLSGLPSGVRAASLLIDPAELDFGDPVTLVATDPDVDPAGPDEV